MKCIKCQKEIRKDFKVCPYCGAKVIQNPVVCPHCSTVVNGDYENCSECGKRLDGKILCPNCKEEVKKDYKFCPVCATSLVEEETKEATNKKVKKAKIEKEAKEFNVVHVVKHSIIAFISLLVFIFSFTNIYTFKIDLGILGIDSSIEMKMSSFDLMSTWNLEGDYNLTDFQYDYADEFEEFENDVSRMKNPTEAKIMNAAREMLEDTNPAKFAKVVIGEQEVEYISLDSYFIIGGVVGLLLIIISAGFLAYSIYGLYASIFKGKKDKLKVPAFEIAIAILFVIGATFVVKMGVLYSGVSSWFITIIVFAILAALIKFVIEACEEYKIGEFSVVGYVSSGIKVIVASVVLGLLYANTTTIKYVVEDFNKTTTLELEYGMRDFIANDIIMNQYSIPEDYKSTPEEINIIYEESIKTYNNHFKDNEDLLKVILIPTMVENGIDITSTKYGSLVGYTVASYVAFSMAILIVVYIGLELSNRKKNEKLALPVVSFALSIVALCFILSANANYIDRANAYDIDVIRKSSMTGSLVAILVIMTILSIFEIAAPEKTVIEEIKTEE